MTLTPNDFRTLSVYPTQEEILSSTNSFVRKNIINGRYNNVDHYLDVHFRLLKEDFVAPLREGIMEYMQLNRGANTSNCDLKSSQVTIHLDVIFRSRTFEKEREGVTLEFSNNKSRESIFSPHSERLIYGSLVVFTKDFFRSVAFGKVMDQDFTRKQLVIGFENKYHDLQLGVPYLMVECKALFEPYYHVLKALQRKTEFDFPMRSYLIDVDARLTPPDYLNSTSSVFTIRNRYVHLFGNNWPTAAELQLNFTQFSAFKAALTQKFVVIQGPPGTGKTYVGLEIVKTLLCNKNFWYNKTPILIVCYTNHALDQFLEKLIPTTTNIVRVGGRSKNEKLKQFNLKNIKKNYLDSLFLQEKIKAVSKQLYMYKDMLSSNTTSGLARQSIVEKMVSLRLCRTELRNLVDAEMMKNKLIIGMTTTGAARLQTTLQMLQCPIIVVEEAAEVMESHITVSLTKDCKHLILIGDHQQLRPSTADYRINQDFNLGISMFERMVLNNIQCHALGVQHRMRPEIAQLIVPHIYPKLENHYSVSQFPSIAGITSNVYFINHKHEERNVDDSKSNLHEAKFLINLACYLRKVGYKPTDITILAPYSSQMHVLHDQSKHFQSWLKDVRICTVDNFQGEESKIILLSLVRNNREGKIGFLNIENRVCVALSRAKEGLYIMGNMKLLSRNSEIWKNIIQVLLKQNSIGDYLTVNCRFHPSAVTKLKEPKDFLKIPEGGCRQICKRLLACGHNCSQVCHDNSTNPCRCFKNKILLACGHILELECNSYNTLVKSSGYPVESKNLPCSVLCKKQIEPCGHTCKFYCHKNADPNHLKQHGCRECYNIKMEAEKLRRLYELRSSRYNQVEKSYDRSSLIWPFNMCCIL